MTCNSPIARLVSHCSTTRTARTSRTGGLMTFTTRIKSYILDNPHVTGLIQDRLEKLSLKGQKFKILEAVSDEDRRRQFAFVHDIDPTQQWAGELARNLNCLKRMTYKPRLRSISEQAGRFRRLPFNFLFFDT